MHLTVESSINRTSVNLIGLTYWAVHVLILTEGVCSFWLPYHQPQNFPCLSEKNVCFVFAMTYLFVFQVYPVSLLDIHLSYVKKKTTTQKRIIPDHISE